MHSVYLTSAPTPHGFRMTGLVSVVKGYCFLPKTLFHICQGVPIWECSSRELIPVFSNVVVVNLLEGTESTVESEDAMIAKEEQ